MGSDVLSFSFVQSLDQSLGPDILHVGTAVDSGHFLTSNHCDMWAVGLITPVSFLLSPWPCSFFCLRSHTNAHNPSQPQQELL